MKGIIIAGGLGTRLLPLTRTINKQLLPVYDRPLIYYPLLTLLRAGISEILIVCAAGHAGQLLEHLGREDFEIEGYRPNFQFVIQKNPTAGIAQALSLGEDFAGAENIAVILGDNIFGEELSNKIKGFENGCKLFFKEVPDAKRFGCPEFDSPLPTGSGRILRIEEKPLEPKSNLCVTGLYLYDNRVWEVIKGVKPSARGQLEITDVNNWYVDNAEASHYVTQDVWIDAGTFDSLLKANNWAYLKAVDK